MGIFDLIVLGLLIFAVFKGIQNGLFVELASFFSLLLGIYLALHFSSLVKTVLSTAVKWNPYTIQVVAFVLTFIIVITGISFAGKLLTKLADFAYLGWINKVGGGFFRMLKSALILSIAFNVFDKINYRNFLAKKETLDQSVFFRPIQKTGNFVFPSLEKIYKGVKEKEK